MRIFDRIDAATLDRRDVQLWVLAVGMILVLAAGLALLMYSALAAPPETLRGPTVWKGFYGFCILSILLVTYLMERQMVIRRLRRALEEEHQHNIVLRHRASADMLETLPGFGNFQDRLAMEFRRAANIHQALSLLVVRLRPSSRLTNSEEITTAWGDAARVLIRRLRGEDSIYLFSPGVFGIVLPGVRGCDANQVIERVGEGLTDASGVSERFSFDIQAVNYPEHVAAAIEMEQLARSYLAPKQPVQQAA
jgi:GGDEF domain-containing protein